MLFSGCFFFRYMTMLFTWSFKKLWKMHQFRYKYCDRDTQTCRKCVASTQITNIKETLTKPHGVYSTVGSTGTWAEKASAETPISASSSTEPQLHRYPTGGLLGTICFVLFCFFFIFRKLENLDLSPIPHIVNGRLKPREMKCMVHIPRSAGSKE